MDTRIDTVIVGGGAAGLGMGKRLRDRGIDFVILDDRPRIGDTWRERYRSLKLFTPRSLAELPGLRLDIGYFDFPTGAQYGDYLERYARLFDLPVRLGTRVTSLARSGARFRLDTASGEAFVADHVVVAAGEHRMPVTPDIAAGVDPGIRQLHSVAYAGPDDLAEGPVLVVGAGNSGTDVALEAARAGHTVTLAGRHPGQVPADIDTPVGNLVSRVFIRKLRRTTVDTAKGRAVREQVRGHGVNLVRNKLKDLDAAGIARLPRISGTDAAGRPVAADGTVVDCRTIVWCTGSVPDFSWISIDGLFDESGWPDEYRGLARSVPGLAFLGLAFQYSIASSTLMGMGADADYLVQRLYTAASSQPALTPAVAS
ncbi:NAD(P)-binding domain-containing protein [Microbacterium sp. 4R-513]|uniref:flavin-containing monooxygenase n=1 Tax=Microbacterium sp. 4R-513 TaxID=2567934 RepID=UPI0013E11C26|nr:NAD(P)/FAD-dependent oxidoreductase [Microbacterium sp. 4R-513]QIG40000.1 NAD(P)-binding domain-containing protein [Microbacterium sp. 4R-513]